MQIRYCPSGVSSFKEDADFLRLHAIIECEQPTDDLYTFKGTILVPPDKMKKNSFSHHGVDNIVSTNARQSLTGHSAVI